MLKKPWGSRCMKGILEYSEHVLFLRSLIQKVASAVVMIRTDAYWHVTDLLKKKSTLPVVQ